MSTISLKVRLLLLMVGSVLLIAIGVSAVHLNGLTITWLEAAKDRAEIAAQQAKTVLSQTLIAKVFPPTATVAEIKAGWNDHASSDQALALALEQTMAQSRGLVEISIANQQGRIVVSTDPNRRGEAMRTYPTIDSVLKTNPWPRFVAALRGRSEYEATTALGIPGETAPVFKIQVIVSSVLLQDTLVPHVTNIAATSTSAVLIAVALSLLATSLAMRPMQKISLALDRISQGATAESSPLPAGLSTKEFAVVKSKLDLLGEQVRGARQLVEKLDDAIVVIDRDQRVTLVGDAAERLLGVRRDELRGKNLDEVFPVSTELGMTLRNAFRLQVPVENRTVTWKAGTSKGPVRLTVNAEPVGSTDGAERTGMIVTLRDPEGRKQVQSQLDLADRLASISRLTSGVAHEIKNPLNAIALRLEVLRAKVEPDVPASADEINIIAEEVTRLDRVVKTFLDFTKPVNLRLVDTEVMDLVRDILRFLAPEIKGAQVEVNIQEEGGPFPIRADYDLLKQAFLNIIRNGVEAMSGQGGTLRIKVERLMGDTSAGQCVVSVSDSGPGIKDEHRDRIFQLYFSTKKGGTGLGLAMAFRAAQLHGGRLEFSSEVGKGTSFLFVLPLVERAASDRQDRALSEPISKT